MESESKTILWKAMMKGFVDTCIMNEKYDEGKKWNEIWFGGNSWKMVWKYELILWSEVDVDKCGADLNSNGVACWKADLRLEVEGFWKTYLHWSPVKVVVFEAKPKNPFEGKNLRFDN